MASADDEFETPGLHARKPYAAPKVIFSELYARGVGLNGSGKDTAVAGTPEYHSPSTESTS
jgi:hypothetical protein